MKAILLLVIVVVLLALDWAALHDILKGEPNLYAEYGMIILSVIIFGIMAFIGLKGRSKGADVA